MTVVASCGAYAPISGRTQPLESRTPKHCHIMDLEDIVLNFEDEEMENCEGGVNRYDFEESRSDQQTVEDTQPEVQEESQSDESDSDNSCDFSEEEEDEDEQIRR